LADVFRRIGCPVEIRRVELDHLISHLADGGDGAQQILRELAAHRVELEAHWHIPGGLEAGGCEGHGGGDREKRAARKVRCAHARTVTRVPGDWRDFRTAPTSLSHWSAA